MTVLATAQLSGFPPKVEMVDLSSESATGAVAINAPSGRPLAMPLAMVIMSGSTP